jgi:hypothetical protein
MKRQVSPVEHIRMAQQAWPIPPQGWQLWPMPAPPKVQARPDWQAMVPPPPPPPNPPQQA